MTTTFSREAIKPATIALGQRVYCGLHGGCTGIVIAIHGEQRPESIGSIGGVMSYGGNANFDVCFDDHFSRMLPECILRGVQWDIYDSVASTDEIIDAVAATKAVVETARLAELAAQDRRAAERITHAESYPHLVKVADKPQWSASRVAAENIRRELKRAFPKVKFGVTSDYSSINVKWTNGPTKAQVKAITDRHQIGTFDGMTDCYDFSKETSFADVFGGAQYVFECRDDTIEAVREANNDQSIPEDWQNDYKDESRRFWRQDAWSKHDFTK